MKKYRLVYLRYAQQDLIQIFDYIQSDNPSAAHQTLKRFDQTLKRLCSFPQSGLVPREESIRSRGYRVLVVGNYLVFYRVNGLTIQVRRVIQGRRQYAFLL